MQMNMITLELDNGDKLAAPIGIWVAALLSELPAEQQTKVKERVGQMMKQAQRQPQLITPGHHVMTAEPLHLNFKGPQNGGV